MDVHVKVYRWDAERARSRPPVQLDVVFEGPLAVDASGPDAARREVQQVAGRRFGKRIRGCSSLLTGGYSIVIDPAVAYP